MKVSRTETAYSGTYVKPAELGRYEMGKIGACKTGHVSPHVSAKGGINKYGSYTSTYSSRTDINQKTER